MTSAQHAAWIKRGSPWRLARPLLALRDRLRGYGYTVYDLGDQGHLDHQPPEHHCPYSEANWPTYQGRPMPDVVTAEDIMPPGGGGLPSLQALGAQLYADKQSGYGPAAFIVDMNWGPTSNRTAVRDTWRPGHSRGSSGDTGHIHLSCRSDFIDWAGADDYDPVARLRGGAPTSSKGNEVNIVGVIGDGARYAVGPAGLVQIGWDEWVASGWENNPPPVLLVKAEKLAAFQAGASVTVDMAALAAALNDKLDAASHEDIVAALESAEGQAALVRAANAAEDS